LADGEVLRDVVGGAELATSYAGDHVGGGFGGDCGGE
jgi:hypothetical protein